MTTNLNTLAEFKRQFAFYGFTRPPLTDGELQAAIDRGCDVYGVGCDVMNGYSYRDAIEANTPRA